MKTEVKRIPANKTAPHQSVLTLCNAFILKIMKIRRILSNYLGYDGEVLWSTANVPYCRDVTYALIEIETEVN